jgi:dATP pyrophosphohydrolase
MPEIVSTHIEVYPFRRAAGGVEFLLLKRRAGSRMGETWQGVHGKIDAGEAAHAAALRELREETGLRPLGFWQLEFLNSFYMARTDRILLSPCFAAEAAPDAVVQLCREHTAFRWVSAAEAQREFLWPGQRRVVEEIMTVIVPRGPAEAFLRIAISESR